MVFGVPSLEHVCIQFLNGTVDESPVARKNRILRKERSDGAASLLLFASSYDATEIGECSVDGAPHSSNVRNIEGHDLQAVASLRLEIIEGVQPAQGCNDAVSACEQLLAEYAAETRRGARDEPSLHSGSRSKDVVLFHH
jgi:hypothetical protein